MCEWNKVKVKSFKTSAFLHKKWQVDVQRLDYLSFVLLK